MWQTISYVSTANPTLKDSDIQDLFEDIKSNNEKNNITGILMYSNGNFFQVLEGEKNKVRNLFNKIKVDYRHYDIIKIFDREIRHKAFSDYNSSFTIVSDNYNHIDDLEHFLEEKKLRNPDNFENIFYLAYKFMKLT